MTVGFSFLYLSAAFVAGGVGGYAALLLGFPLPWLLGAMFASFVFGVLIPRSGDGNDGNRNDNNGKNDRPVFPPFLRRLALVVIGLYLGSQFARAEDLISAAKTAPLSIAAVLVCTAASGVLAFVFLLRFLRLDAVTAYCAAVPGGLSPAVGLAAAHNADAGTVALMHSVRVAMVVWIAPFAAGVLPGEAAGGMFAGMFLPQPAAGVMSAGDALTAVLVAAAAMALGSKLGAVGGSLLPALVLSSAASYAGRMVGALPLAPLAMAMIVLGVYAGLSLAGLRRGAAGKVGIAGFLMGTMMMGVAALFAFALSAATGLPSAPLWLALAPGGIGEMALTAMELNASPHWVLLHHFARITALLLISPFILRAIIRREKKRNGR